MISTAELAWQYSIEIWADSVGAVGWERWVGCGPSWTESVDEEAGERRGKP